MLAEARRAGEQECCGLLGGRDTEITRIFPAANALASAARFEIAPPELFAIFREMREAGLDHLGIYHSHPRGPAVPSAVDIEQSYYPGVAYFVVSGGAVRAFHIANGSATELKLQVTDEPRLRCG